MRNIPSAELYRSYRQIVTVVACNYGFSQSQVRQGTFVYDSRMVEGDSFQVGTAVADEITVELDNTTGVYGKNAIGEEFEIYLSATDGTNETDKYLLGTYICVGAEETSSNISTLTMQDKMILFDKVIPSFTPRWTVRKALDEFCKEVKVPMRLTNEEDAFLRTLFIWEGGNEQGITYRDFIRGVALIMCENAYITNTGYLAFKSIHDYGEVFTASERYSSEVGEKAKIGGVVVMDDDGNALFNEGIEGAYNIVIDPSSSVILNLIGGVSTLAGKYEMQETLPIPGRAIFGREYYPLGMATLSWWEIETGDIIRYVAKGGEVYPSIVTSCASILNGKTSITSTADEELRDIPAQTDAIRTTTKALADAADDASKVATNYLNFNEQTGLDVGYSGTLAKTRISGGGVEIFDAQGVSMQEISSRTEEVDGQSVQVPFVRTGYTDQGHVETSSGGIDIKYGPEDTEYHTDLIAHLGYGDTVADPIWGEAQPGEIVKAPFYSFGPRALSWEDNDNVDHNADVGQYSHVTGKDCVGGGPWSYVGGYGNVTLNDQSFSTVVGYWNDPSEPGAFVVGGGSSPTIGQRRNTMVVGGANTPVVIHGNTVVDGEISSNNIDAIGMISGAVNGSTTIGNVSVPANAWTNLGSFELGAGLWIVKVTLRWATKTNATGYRTVAISTSPNEDGLSVWNNAKELAATTGYTYVHLVTFLNPTSTTTYYVNAYNSDTSAHTCATRWGAVCIKGVALG